MRAHIMLGDFAKRFGKKYAKKFALKIIKLVIVKTAPIWGPTLAIVAIIFLLYILIFELPKTAITDSYNSVKERVSAFFIGSPDYPDEDVFERYMLQAERWNEGLSQEQNAQVQAYALNWEWLAQVDRTLNDPAFLGLYEGIEEKEVNLKPEKTFEEVRPYFEWETYTKKIVTQACEANEKKDKKGKTETEYTVTTSTTYEDQVLLLLARTIQNEYHYSYIEETTTSTESSECGTLETTITQKQLQSIDTVTVDWEPMRDILIAHGVERDIDQDFLIEYWFDFLVTPDGTEYEPLPSDWQPVEKDFLWPANGRVSSQFGSRIDPITNERTEHHNGLDIAAKKGSKIIAAKDGTVIYADSMGTAGKAVIIKHEGVETRYYHMNRILVTKGDDVKAGDVIGEVGSTGASTGPHLHFEIRIGGKPVDPLPFFIGGDET